MLGCGWRRASLWYNSAGAVIGADPTGTTTGPDATVGERLMDESNRIAFLDCFSGASGDMLLGALLDAGLPLAELQA